MNTKKRNFMDYVDGLSADTMVSSTPTTPVHKKTVAEGFIPKKPVRRVVVEKKDPKKGKTFYEMLDEGINFDYLEAGGWRYRGEVWFDPMTNEQVEYPIALAIQRERVRVGTRIIESTTHRPGTNTTTPSQTIPLGGTQYASALLDDDIDPSVAAQMGGAGAMVAMMAQQGGGGDGGMPQQLSPDDMGQLSMEERMMMGSPDMFIPQQGGMPMPSVPQMSPMAHAAALL